MKRLIRILKKAEVRKYLVVGAWNTIFGYLCFAVIYYLFSKVLHYYIILAICNVLAITNAFLFFKFYVFQTKGNFWKEYFKCYVVYSFSIGLNFLLFPIFMIHLFPKLYALFGLMSFEKTIPYIAQAAIIGISIVFSYLGHKYFSFRKKQPIARPS